MACDLVINEGTGVMSFIHDLDHNDFRAVEISDCDLVLVNSHGERLPIGAMSPDMNVASQSCWKAVSVRMGGASVLSAVEIGIIR